MILLCCGKHGRPTLIICCVKIHISISKELYNAKVSFFRRNPHRCCTIFHCMLQISSSLRQELDHLEIAKLACDIQGSGAVVPSFV